MTSKGRAATFEANPHLGHGHPKGLRDALGLTATAKAKIFDLTDAPPSP